MGSCQHFETTYRTELETLTWFSNLFAFCPASSSLKKLLKKIDLKNLSEMFISVLMASLNSNFIYQNLPLERIRSDVNARVNYLIKKVLVEMDNNMEIEMNVDVHKFALWPFLVLWLDSDWTKWFRLGILILYLVCTFLTKKKMLFYCMEIEIWKSNLNLKFEFQFKQKSKFDFYFLFSIFWKIENTWKDSFFKSSLGDVTDQRSASAQKRFHEITKRNSFFNFYWNRNWDLKFVFRFDNENEKRKKFQILLNVPFDPRITDDPCTESIIRSLISKQKEFWEFFIFHFSIS